MRPIFSALALLAAAIPAFSQPLRLQLDRSRFSRKTEIRGSALSQDRRTLYTWGDGLRSWSLPGLQAKTLATGPFMEGGCLMDVDGDGLEDLILQEGLGLGKLVWRKAPGWEPRTIDTEIEMHDCLEAELLGHRGVLMIQRYMQVRLYEPPPIAGQPWGYNELYSIYTPSQQTGLLLADVDGDGRTDIFAGNYWIRSPERFALPWRLFAINLYSEEPDSAMLRLASVADSLAVAQGHRKEARLAIFQKPADPTQLWKERRLDGGLHLVRPHGLQADPHHQGEFAFYVGEHAGAASRILLVPFDAPVREVARGRDVLALWRLESGQLLSVGSDNVSLWRPK